MNPSCETCAFWRQGDLSPKNIRNVGQCAWMFPRSSEFYAKAEHAPFWAADLSQQTASYDGGNCKVYERSKPRRKKP